MDLEINMKKTKIMLTITYLTMRSKYKGHKMGTSPDHEKKYDE